MTRDVIRSQDSFSKRVPCSELENERHRNF